MNREQAFSLVKQTFTQAFDKNRFSVFSKNLLNHIDESKAEAWNKQYIKEAFRNHVQRYERLRTYTSPNKETLDVLIVHLTNESKLEHARTALRNFVADHLKTRDEKDAALVAFISPTEKQWRFSYVKMEYATVEKNSGNVGVETKLTPARRMSYIVGEGESCHTAQTRFLGLLQETTPDPLLKDIEEAFNIEQVTKEFFEKYRDLFIRTKGELDKTVGADTKTKAEFQRKGIDTVNFSKKLLGQIVFLYFLQRKGWFGVPRDAAWGKGPKNFLRQLLEKKYGDYKNFFNDILEPLFYEALRIDRSHDDHYYSRFDCKIPFLNGGLFDPINEYDWVNTDILLPNELFHNTKETEEGDIGDGIFDIFDRYNFTVKEDEPLEKEVAIDPELLGKAYEKFNAIRPDNFDEYKKALRSGKKGEEIKFNKQFGVYYTPREIVHYMCQQSLINYLETELSGKVSREAIEFLIVEGEKLVERLKTAQQKLQEDEDYNGKYKTNKAFDELKSYATEIDSLLANIKLCDPAVGSGAFLVGMMTEIVRARKFFAETNCLKENYTNAHGENVKRIPYHFKRDCIENSLYGVDIDPGAVEIAKLRLWLSLVVDEDDPRNIRPLPNLDYKIACGNSLIGLPEGILLDHKLLNELEEQKKKYFAVTNPTEKRDLRTQIEDSFSKLVAGASQYASSVRDVNFDFHTHFSEVFHGRGGFDVVIGNPPYGAKFTENEKSYLNVTYPVIKGQPESYEYFIYISIKKLSSRGGITSIICPTNFIESKRAEGLRELILESGSIHIISNFRFNVWEENAAETLVFVHQKGVRNGGTRVLHPKSLEEFESATEFELVHQEEWRNQPAKRFLIRSNNSLIKKIEEGCSKLGDISEVSQGIIVYKTREQSKKNPYISNKPKLGSVWKKLLDGHSRILPYKIIWGGSYLKYGDWLWCPRDDRFFEEPKILFVRLRNKSLERKLVGAFDDSAFYNRDNFNNIILKDKSFSLAYILALFNSRLINHWYKAHFDNVNINPEQVRLIPIKRIPMEKQKLFADKVEQIQKIVKQKPDSETTSLEREIDQLVFKLYGLNEEEIKIVEGFK